MMNSNIELTTLQGILLGAAILFTTLFILGFLRSVTGRWYLVESAYGTQSVRLNRKFSFCTVKLASMIDPIGVFTALRGTGKVGLTKHGLYIGSMLPFDPFFKSVLIPWGDFSIVRVSYLGLDQYELELVRLPEVKIILPPAVAQEVRAYQQQDGAQTEAQ
jgi:hypothetical protein